MKTTYTLTEAQTYLQLTPRLFEMLAQKYGIVAQNPTAEATARTYCAPDVERLRFDINRRRGPFITLLNTNYAPDFGLAFCRMLREANSEPIAVVAVSQMSGAERLGAVVPGAQLEEGIHRYELPSAKASPRDFLPAWDEWERSLEQVVDEYAKVVLWVEAEAHLLEAVLLSSGSLCLLLPVSYASQGKRLIEELQARVRIVRRLRSIRAQLDLTAVVVVGENEAERRRCCERLQGEQPRVIIVPPDLRGEGSFLPYWYQRKRA